MRTNETYLTKISISSQKFLGSKALQHQSSFAFICRIPPLWGNQASNLCRSEMTFMTSQQKKSGDVSLGLDGLAL